MNELGKRLGFEVEFGRYRGNQAAIGFDGMMARREFLTVTMGATLRA
jgi:hypothetical protein